MRGQLLPFAFVVLFVFDQVSDLVMLLKTRITHFPHKKHVSFPNFSRNMKKSILYNEHIMVTVYLDED
jgi:hypothetical protein